MKKNFTFYIHGWKIFFIVFLLLTACNGNDKKINGDEVIAKADSNNSLAETNPDHVPGAEIFRQNCTSCHSVSYIENQPAFAQKTWEKIVDKMIKNFGAPISDSTAQNIVKYLVAIKGKN